MRSQSQKSLEFKVPRIRLTTGVRLSTQERRYHLHSISSSHSVTTQKWGALWITNSTIVAKMMVMKASFKIIQKALLSAYPYHPDNT